MEYVDLRSDTVTKPTPEMREAMAEAEVGDDVYRDDPTVNGLEALAAEKLGKESAIFVPSGTMGNLLALLVHCQRGDEVIAGNKSHIYLNEAGGMSALGGIQPCPIPNQKDGTLALDDILASIRSEDVHHPITRLICLENTQNICGGVPLTADYTRQVGEIARKNNLALHIDGARIFNSAVTQNVDGKDPYDTLGIPGAVLGDIINTTDFAAQLTGPRRNPFFLLILRSSAIGRNILEQARSKNPTFITCWIGNNDVLGYATGGGANPSLLTSAALFNTLYRQLMDSLRTITPILLLRISPM